MRKIIVILGCAAVLLSACGKKEEQKQTTLPEQSTAQVQEQQSSAEPQPIAEIMKATAADVVSEDEETLPEAKYIEDVLTKRIDGDSEKLMKEFAHLNDAEQYYFCAAFAMGAMSAAKPVTASVMVTYFMGLGVAKYNVGINDETYMTFNAGKNVFMHENLVNTVLESKVCENIINDATEYAIKKNISVAELDKLGQIEVEKVVKYIQAEQ
ncbi:MAG: hypothetical protein IJ738_05760 [Alphaproteobacteria bacterium]|nr:hypothetical protein [Alphaproteobacteria bacterium]MBR1757051.1 hypothetical protein [Alphaproteobacteria bacterium]